MDFLLAVRRQGFRPEHPVWVFVDEHRPRPPIWGDLPLEFELCVLSCDDAGGLDFRGLIGLSVAVTAKRTDNRLRALLRAIQRVRPSDIGGGVPSEGLIFSWNPRLRWQFDEVTP
jgi:hypothetical protein